MKKKIEEIEEKNRLKREAEDNQGIRETEEGGDAEDSRRLDTQHSRVGGGDGEEAAEDAEHAEDSPGEEHKEGESPEPAENDH